MLLSELRDERLHILLVDERGAYWRARKLEKEQADSLDLVVPRHVVEQHRAEIFDEGEGGENDPVHEPL